MKFDQVENQQTQTILLYGESGTGKTLKVGRLAKYFNLVWFDLENGMATLVTHLSKEEKQKIEAIRIPDSKSNPIAIQTLVKLFTKAGKHKVCDAHGRINCPTCKTDITEIDLHSLDSSWIVVIDSLTQLAASALNYAMRNYEGEKPEWDHYTSQVFNLEQILTVIQSGKFHCCVISHDADISKDDKKVDIRPIGGTRKFSANLAKYFNHVIYLRKFNGKYTGGSGGLYLPNVQTKTRTDLLYEKISEKYVDELGGGLELIFFSNMPEHLIPEDVKVKLKALRESK